MAFDFLDVSKLEDEQIGHLAWVLNSPSYTDVFEPYLKRMRNSLNVQLLDPSSQRKSGYPDDYLRGGIAMVDGLLALFKKLLEETEVEHIARTIQEITPNQQYDQLRAEGKIQPGVAYDPREDF